MNSFFLFFVFFSKKFVYFSQEKFVTFWNFQSKDKGFFLVFTQNNFPIKWRFSLKYNGETTARFDDFFLTEFSFWKRLQQRFSFSSDFVWVGSLFCSSGWMLHSNMVLVSWCAIQCERERDGVVATIVLQRFIRMLTGFIFFFLVGRFEGWWKMWWFRGFFDYFFEYIFLNIFKQLHNINDDNTIE